MRQIAGIRSRQLQDPKGQDRPVHRFTHLMSAAVVQVCRLPVHVGLHAPTHWFSAAQFAVPPHEDMHEATQVREASQPSGVPLQRVQAEAHAPVAAHQYCPDRHLQTPELQLVPPEQAMQAAPPVPQAALPVPGWQVLPWQQPAGHEVGSQMQAPPKQR